MQIWSIENEWLYINCINLYGGLMDQFEAQSRTRWPRQRGKAVDPTRPCMTDGGGAGKAQACPSTAITTSPTRSDPLSGLGL